MTNSLKEYAEIFRELELTELSVEEDNFKLTLKKKAAGASICKSDSENCKEENGICSRKQESEGNMDGGQDKAAPKAVVKAPLLGVFFAEVGGKVRQIGDMVQKGDVLCSIEAMKMMNDVKAPCDGVITRINAKDADLVEYDQVLFELA